MGLMKASMTLSPRIPFLRVALLACALFACLAASASATHWPAFGGDAGRSGHQPVDAGAMPLALDWKRTGADDKGIRTSVVVSGGAPASQLVMYGTGDGVVHLRRLEDGTPVGGADVGDDADVFGPIDADPGENQASVSFADTSTEEALGQLFVAHNEGTGIEIAHFDEADGSLVQQFAVPGTAGMTIQSSLLATGDALFFVAGGRLWKVPVTDWRSRDASFGTPASTPDVDATPVASPALANLDVLGTPTAHVAIGTEDGDLRTYRASDLGAGPAVTGLPLADEVLTPIVPVQPDGDTPESAPFIYVSATSDFFGPASAAIYKIGQDAGALVPVTLAPFPGHPSPAMAVTQLATPEMDDGKLLLGTSINLFLASTRDLDVVGSFDTEFDLNGGTDGFQQTTGAVSGDYFYVTNDQGEQFVARVLDGKPVIDTDQFERDAENTGVPNGGHGQPAVSRGWVVYGGPDGVFAYRNRDLTPPDVALTAPAPDSTASGAMTVAASASDERGVEQVEFRANARTLGVDTTPGDGFSVTVDTDDMPAGEYVLDAIASDGTLTTASEPRRVVIRSRGDVGPGTVEDAPPSVSFTRPGAGSVLSGSPTLSAAAADDRGIASVRFLAGERVLCTDTTAPYDCAYRLSGDDVGKTTLVAIATDTAGQTGAALRGVRVSRFSPPGLSARTTPSRDDRAPFRFTTSGRLRMPAGVTRAQGCATGDVAVVFKAANKTISTRRAKLTRSCGYRSSVSFRSRKRFPKSGRLTVRVRFLGNAVLGPRRAKSTSVRTR
jgi:hypothetical protein